MAAMLVHLLTERGATVRQIMRDGTDDAHMAEFALSRFDALCIIGLFDPRGYERILRLIPALGPSEGDANVFIGVDRSPDAEPDTSSHNINIHRSLGALCTAMLS